MSSKIRSPFRNTPPIRLIVLSFMLVILTGTILLIFPFCSRNGSFTAPIDALFVATSATCVTGLSPFDTWTHWNEVGQLVIILLIQVGGLGLVTFTTGVTMLLRRKMGLKELRLAVENTNGESGLIRHLIRITLGFTFSCELLGALLLMIRFVPIYGPYGIWISVFTAISAFCNAGFDILGLSNPGQSLIPYVADPLVCVTSRRRRTWIRRGERYFLCKNSAAPSASGSSASSFPSIKIGSLLQCCSSSGWCHSVLFLGR